MKKNKIFANKINKVINNNQKMFDISEKESDAIFHKEISNDNLSVKEKIDKLLSRNGYVFNVNVEIITYQKTYNTYIAGMVNNHLVTLDKDIINISDIKDIIIKE